MAYSYGPYSYGLYSCGLYGYGLYSYGRYSYGRRSAGGLCDCLDDDGFADTELQPLVYRAELVGAQVDERQQVL